MIFNHLLKIAGECYFQLLKLLAKLLTDNLFKISQAIMLVTFMLLTFTGLSEIVYA